MCRLQRRWQSLAAGVAPDASAAPCPNLTEPLSHRRKIGKPGEGDSDENNVVRIKADVPVLKPDEPVPGEPGALKCLLETLETHIAKDDAEFRNILPIPAVPEIDIQPVVIEETSIKLLQRRIIQISVFYVSDDILYTSEFVTFGDIGLKV